MNWKVITSQNHVNLDAVDLSYNLIQTMILLAINATKADSLGATSLVDFFWREGAIVNQHRADGAFEISVKSISEVDCRSEGLVSHAATPAVDKGPILIGFPC